MGVFEICLVWFEFGLIDVFDNNVFRLRSNLNHFNLSPHQCRQIIFLKLLFHIEYSNNVIRLNNESEGSE